MKQLDVEHHSFDVVREYPVSPPRVFEAWADAELKRQWFAEEEGWTTEEYSLDFREGGGERLCIVSPAGQRIVYSATLEDIVVDRRIVYAYSMGAGGVRASVSLASVSFEAELDGTRLVIVEHHALLDGHDDVASRRAGVESMLRKLATALGGAG